MFQVANIHWYMMCFLLFCSFCFESVAMEPSELLGAESRKRSDLEFVQLTKTPLTRIESGGVFAVRALIHNTGSAPAVGQLVGKLAGQTGEEHRRQIELDAGEQRYFELRLRISPKLKSNDVTAIVTLNAIENGRDIMLQQGDEPISQTLTMPFDIDTLATAITLESEPLPGPYWRWPALEPFASYEIILAARVDAGLSRRCIILDGLPIPLTSTDWQDVDSFVIGNAEVLKDAAVLAVLQTFLQRGGRILVLLENIDTALLRDLLADGQQCETIDTIELNHFVMDIRAPIQLSLAERTVDRDIPMRLKRVIQQGGRVTHSIDGWPVAISMTIGEGELLLTTLDSSAWLKVRVLQRSIDPLHRANFTVPLWGAYLTSELGISLRQEPLEAVESTYPMELIGSPVLPRKWVGATLIGFCVLLVGAGAWIAVVGDLKSIGFLAPGLAFAASIPLVVAAMWTRSDIPSMSSELQIIQFGQNGGGRIRGKAAVYLAASRSMELVGNSEGFASASENIESGIRLFATTDFQKWKLSNTDWPPGTWRYQTETWLTKESFSAAASLTSKGLELELPQGLPSPPEDIIVNFTTGSPCMGNLLDQNSRLLVDGSFPSDRNRWTSAAIVSDEQGRRAKVYNEIFLSPDSLRAPLPRSLYFWTKLWPQSPRWNSNLERRGAALVTVPIRLAEPAVGSKVLIPYSLISVEASTNAVGYSSIFKYRTGRWADESTLEVDADLSFVLPPEVVPIDATSIQVDFDIEAPKRKVRLIWSANDSPVELMTLDSPSIPWRGTITDPRVLKDLTDGRLDLRIEVTNSERLATEAQDNFVSWRIKHLHLSVSGQTLPRNNLAVHSKK